MVQLQPANPSAEALEKGYEPEGVRFWTLIGIMLSIGLVVAVMMAIAAWLIIALTRRDLAAEQVPSAVPAPMVNTGLPPLQPSPAHDTTAAEDLILMRKHESDTFTSLGWKLGPDRKFHPPDEVVAAVAARQAKGGK
jgi:hypothetical protein